MAMLTLMDRMGQDMQLRGLAGCTQEVYRGTVESVARFCGRPPNALDTLTEEELRQYFLHLVHERHASRSTLRIRRAGLRFLVETTLRRTWPCSTNCQVSPLYESDISGLNRPPNSANGLGFRVAQRGRHRSNWCTPA